MRELKMTSKRKKGTKGIEEVNHSLNKIARGAGIVFICMMLGKFLGYFYVMFIARLGTENFGLINLGLSVVSLIGTIAILGLDNGILRYVPYFLAKNDKAKVRGVILSSLKIVFFIGLTVSLLIFLSAPFISVNLFHNAKLIPILKIFALMIPFSILGSILLPSFRAFQYVEYESGLKEVGEKAIRLAFTIILVFLGFGVIGVAYPYLFSAILIFVLSVIIFQKKVFPIFGKGLKSKSSTRELLIFSLPLLLSNILVYAIVWIDTLMLGYFRTAAEVGIYNAAHPTAALMFVLPTALISLFLPIITGYYSRKKFRQVEEIYKRVSKWIFFVNFPLLLLMAIFSRQIIRIIFGQDYLSATTPLAILVFGYLVYSLSYTSSNILSMAKKTKLIFYITLIFTASNILFNYLLIPKYGVNGAAVATSLSYITGSLFFVFFGYRKIRILPVSKSFFKSILAGIISIFLVYFLTRLFFVSVPLYAFIIMFMLFLAAYSLLLFLFKSFDREDIEIIKIILGKIGVKRK